LIGPAPLARTPASGQWRSERGVHAKNAKSFYREPEQTVSGIEQHCQRQNPRSNFGKTARRKWLLTLPNFQL